MNPLPLLAEIPTDALLRSGKPLAVMIFKTYGFISCAQGIGYAGDMKLGHYVKIPPRTLFFAQLSASLVACFVGLGVAGFQSTSNFPLVDADW